MRKTKFNTRKYRKRIVFNEMIGRCQTWRQYKRWRFDEKRSDFKFAKKTHHDEARLAAAEAKRATRRARNQFVESTRV